MPKSQSPKLKSDTVIDVNNVVNVRNSLPRVADNNRIGVAKLKTKLQNPCLL